MYEVMNPTQPRAITKSVWCYSATAVNLVEGQGLCYGVELTQDLQGSDVSALLANGDVMNIVALPNASNYLNFAGVTSRAELIPAGGKMIVINEPGSICKVAIGAATTKQSTILTASATVGERGRFSRQGRIGRGTVLCLQTRAADAATAAGTKATTTTTIDYDNIVAKVITESLSIASTGVATLTDFFLRAVVGDYVVVLGGAKSDGLTQATAGLYKISVRTSKDAATLVDVATGLLSPCAETQLCAAYIYRGNPTVLAYLYDGEESGLQQTVAPKTSGSAAVPDMLFGGTNWVVCGGITCGTGTTVTVPDATAGMKRFTVLYGGTITTAGVIITPTSSNIVGFKVGGTYGQRVALSSVVPAVAGGGCVLEWDGKVWDWIGGLGVST